MKQDRADGDAARTPDAVCRRLGVSRETQDRLEAYADLLIRWQSRINLVGPRTIPDLWHRHILDSGQLALHCRALPGVWYDLGSGGGFPGLVLAILGLGPVQLVESDQRKCAFLREAARVTETEVSVHASRIDALAGRTARTISARALAPLPRLLELAAPLLGADTTLWLWKGQDVEAELTQTAKYWRMRVERRSSITDPKATLLHLSEVARVQFVRPDSVLEP